MLHCATVANLVLRLFSPLATPGAWARGCVVAGQVARRETGTILGGVTTPLEFISCSFVSPYHASATFHATFFLQIAIRILRKVDATLTVFVTFQLPQIQRITFCLFSILTFCLITDRRIRPLINYKPPLPPNSGKSLGICRVRVHLVILNQCMVLYIIISPSGMEVVLFFFLNRKRTSPC